MEPTLAHLVLAGLCVFQAAVPTQVRTTDCTVAETISRGMSQSTTFRQIVERVGALDGIVYISRGYVFRDQSGHPLPGALHHRVVRAGSYRLLYVTVAPDSVARAIAILGHELQHAIEVLESGATSERQIDALFDRIGAHAGSFEAETDGALNAQRAIAKELASAR